jgi:hypothetical protein
MMQRRRVFSLLAGAIGGCCVMKADTTESQQQDIIIKLSPFYLEFSVMD